MKFKRFGTYFFLSVLLTLFGIPSFSTTRTTAIELNNDGIHALDKRQWNRAIEKLTAALLVDPSYTLARENLATAHNNYGLELRTKNEHESFRQFHYAVYFDHDSMNLSENLKGMAVLMGWNLQKHADCVELGNRFLKEGDIVSAYVEYVAASKLKCDSSAAKTLSAKLQKLEALWDSRSSNSLDDLRTSQVNDRPELLGSDSSIFAENTFMVVLKLEQMADWDHAQQILRTYSEMVPASDAAWTAFLFGCRHMKDHKESEAFLIACEKHFDNVPSKLRFILETLMEVQAEWGELEALQVSRRLFLSKFPDVHGARITREQVDYFEKDYADIRRSQSGDRPLFLSFPVMPIKVYFGPGKAVADGNGIYTRSVSQKFCRIAKNALNAWVSATNNRLKFVVVEKLSDADIVCEWTTDYSRRVYTFTDGETKTHGVPQNKVSATILVFLNAKHLLSDSQFYGVCLHEFGHALGLPHSVGESDVMYWGGTNENIRVAGKEDIEKLSNNDKARIRAIYNDPFEAKNIAFEFAQAAYVDGEYEKAYRLLSAKEQNQNSLIGFEEQIKSDQSISRPNKLQMYSVKIFATNVTFVLLGADGAIKSYYYMEIVRNNDGRFEVTKPRRVN